MAFFRCKFKSSGETGGGVTLTVTCDEDFAGLVISCSDGTTILTQTCPSVSPYVVEFDIPNSGTWTVSGTIDGGTFSKSVTVIIEYSTKLIAGFDWKEWVTLGGLDPTDYTDLDDVFDDETAVRRLMLVHDSADFLIESVTERLSTIDDFTANDTAMKWIGLCDYVCDGLTAITGVEDEFLASEYWERYLKDHVPAMTSDSAPYGTAFGSSYYSTDPYYKAFDGSTSTWWTSNNASGTGDYIGYAFVSPINVKDVYIAIRNNRNESNTISYKIQASNDNSTWTDLSEEISTTLAPNEIVDTHISISNDDYYLRYRIIKMSETTGSRFSFAIIQFYGRSLNVSVPIMTSNTAPYGEANCYKRNTSGGQPYLVFDGNDTTYVDQFYGVSGTPSLQWLQYKFTHKVSIKKVYYKLSPGFNGGEYITSCEIQGSDTGRSNDFHTIATFTNLSGLEQFLDVETELEYTYIRLQVLTTHSSRSVGFCTLHFYGVDYSEKEFEEGTTKKWLYDHGLKVENNIRIVGTDGSDFARLSAVDNKVVSLQDLSDYSLARAIVGANMSGTTKIIVGSTANATITSANAPNNNSLNISSINNTDDVGVYMTAQGIFDLAELWLE